MSEQTVTAPPLKSSEAIFAVADVLASVRFYRDILGFDGEWLWGDPPNFAGLRWGKIQVLVCQQPELAGKIEGHQHFFRCHDVDAMHDRHKAANAPIISPIENKPWGIREYTIRDINGYHLRFGGPPTYERPATARDTMPDFIQIIERMPTVEEFAALTHAVGWNADTTTFPSAIKHSLYGVVALDTRSPAAKQIAGSIRVVGDGVRSFYIQDVMVMPQLQSQRIGSAMMETVMHWLKRTAPKGAFIGLFTHKPAFYERYGFQPAAGGMCLGL